MKGKIITILIVLAILSLSLFINSYNYKILSQQEVRRIRISINERAGVDLINYPLKIVLTNNNFTDWNYLSSDGSDIYFTDLNGNPLYYWIESFDYNNKIVVIWVKISFLLSANSITEIFMWYGGTNPYTDYRDMIKATTTLFTSFEDGAMPNWMGFGAGYTTPNVVQATDSYDGVYQLRNTNYGGTTSQNDYTVWRINIVLPYKANTVRLVYYEKGGYYQSYWHPHTYKNDAIYQDFYNTYSVQTTWTQRKFNISSSSGVNDITTVGISYNKDHTTTLRYIPWVAIDYLFVYAFVDPPPNVIITEYETITTPITTTTTPIATVTETITTTITEIYSTTITTIIPTTITSTYVTTTTLTYTTTLPTTIISTVTETLTETTTYTTTIPITITTTMTTTVPTTISTTVTYPTTITTTATIPTTITTTYTTIVPTTITETLTETTTYTTTYVTTIPTTIVTTYTTVVPTTITTTTEIPVTITATPTVSISDIAQVLTAVGLIGAVLVGAFKGKKTLAKSEYFEKERKE